MECARLVLPDPMLLLTTLNAYYVQKDNTAKLVHRPALLVQLISHIPQQGLLGAIIVLLVSICSIKNAIHVLLESIRPQVILLMVRLY